MASRMRVKKSQLSALDRMLNELRYWFELDEAFAHLQKQRWFRISGSLLNVISAIALGIMLHNWPIGLLCLLTLPVFLLCMRVVRTGLAIILGLLLAAYWSVVGWAFSMILVDVLGPGWGLALILAGSFFLSSLILHIRYIRTRIL